MTMMGGGLTDIAEANENKLQITTLSSESEMMNRGNSPSNNFKLVWNTE